ncbi:hypothetical protein [Rhizobacter sp. SG703]|uniref:hypothetical protein n=1 Tax=Rhizobacter sp. SG703 TaxID=2587140 RepID=UPI0014466602|nr:hypothetical protein [Rhizobacter sp. SG703]NKI92772.1 hypothetical protein [Rhizobacter sp. SG703]
MQPFRRVLQCCAGLGAPLTDEERDPQRPAPIPLQIEGARRYLAANVPSSATLVKGGVAGTVTFLTLAILLLHKSENLARDDADHQDGVVSAAQRYVSIGSAMSLVIAISCVVVCLGAAFDLGMSCASRDAPAEPA